MNKNPPRQAWLPMGVYNIYIYIYVIFIDVDHLSYHNELSPQAPINSEARPNQTAQNQSLAASFGEPCKKPAPAYHALSPIVDDAQPTQDAKRDV